MHHLTSYLIRIALLALALFATPGHLMAEETSADSEIWVPPAPNALDAKRDFGAVGDGKADDTAALQKALDGLHDAVNKGKTSTLVIPPGTYRITNTLRMVSDLQITLTGLDPATTRIVWDGPKTADPAREATEGILWPAMIQSLGVRWAVISRMTLDGAGSEAVGFYHAWDNKTPGPGTYNRHEDMVYTNLYAGIWAGRSGLNCMDAETAVTRCTFSNCSGSGVVINSFNALDWWIWHCRFTNNAIGVTNCLDKIYGGGNFHVYESLFEHSKITDIQMGHCSYFGIRGNRSEGSQMFVRTLRPTGWGPKQLGHWPDDGVFPNHIHIQNNAILDSIDPTPIQRTDSGATLLTDNIVRRSADAADKPWVKITGPGTTTIVAVGNRVSPAGPLSATQVVEIDTTATLPDKITNADKAGVIAPTASGPIVDVPVGDAAGLQTALDNAGKSKGQHPVIRLPEGTYSSDNGFTIPEGSDLILFGENNRTRLVRTSPGAVVTIPAATPATLRGMDIGAPDRNAKWVNITGVACTTSGSADSGLWTDQALMGGSEVCEDFADTGKGYNELRSNQMGGDKPIGIRLRGGRTWMLGGAAGSYDAYNISNGATMVVHDTWYEGGKLTFLMLTDRGNMTIDGAMIAPGRPGPNMAHDPESVGVNMRDFKGSLSLIDVMCQTIIRRTGDAQFLFLGSTVENLTEWPFTDDNKGVVCLGSTYSGKLPDGTDGTLPLPALGANNKDDLVKLLAATREAKPAPPRAEMVRLIRITTNIVNCGVSVSAAKSRRRSWAPLKMRAHWSTRHRAPTMKKIIAPLLGLTAFALFATCTQAQSTNAAPAAANAPIRVACVGDSLTIGDKSTKPYPAQLQALLGNGWLVKNFGVGARTMIKKGDWPYWKEKAYADAKDFAPNVVIIMLGSNDTRMGNWQHFNDFAADYKEFIESFKNLPPQLKIFICRRCPVFGAGNYSITEAALDQVITAIDQVAKDENVWSSTCTPLCSASPSSSPITSIPISPPRRRHLGQDRRRRPNREDSVGRLQPRGDESARAIVICPVPRSRRPIWRRPGSSAFRRCRSRAFARGNCVHLHVPLCPTLRSKTKRSRRRP